MVKTVTADQFANELVDMMTAYTEDVSKGIEGETKSTADKVLKETVRLAPRKYGEYVKGFKKTKKKLKSGVEYYVWNKKHYRRVHLLEKSHAKVNGGRVPGKPHLGPAHDKYVDGYYNNIKKIIKNGGG